MSRTTFPRPEIDNVDGDCRLLWLQQAAPSGEGLDPTILRRAARNRNINFCQTAHAVREDAILASLSARNVTPCLWNIDIPRGRACPDQFFQQGDLRRVFPLIEHKELGHAHRGRARKLLADCPSAKLLSRRRERDLSQKGAPYVALNHGSVKGQGVLARAERRFRHPLPAILCERTNSTLVPWVTRVIHHRNPVGRQLDQPFAPMQ